MKDMSCSEKNVLFWIEHTDTWFECIIGKCHIYVKQKKHEYRIGTDKNENAFISGTLSVIYQI